MGKWDKWARRATAAAALAILGTLLTGVPAHAGITVSIDDFTQDFQEGDSGTRPMRFKVRLSAAPTKVTKVDYATVEKDPQAFGWTKARKVKDFVPVSGTLTFQPGQKMKTINVPIVGDESNEVLWESFRVKLSNPVRANLGSSVSEGVITNDDPMPDVVVDEKTMAEGATTAFGIGFDTALERPITVYYWTKGSESGVPATMGSDFEEVSGSFVIPGGQKRKTFSLSTLPDPNNTDEDDEVFIVEVSAPIIAGPTGGNWSGAVTIADEDPPPTVSIADQSLLEGTFDTTPREIVITYTGASQKDVGMTVTVTPGTASAEDYLPPGSSLSSMSSLMMQFDSDSTDEPDETFTVTLSNAQNLEIIDGTATITILDDDEPF